jgi:hypothetical protein
MIIIILKNLILLLIYFINKEFYKLYIYKNIIIINSALVMFSIGLISFN